MGGQSTRLSRNAALELEETETLSELRAVAVITPALRERRSAGQWQRRGLLVGGIAHTIALLVAVAGAAALRWWDLGVPNLSMAEVNLIVPTTPAVAIQGNPLAAKSLAYLFLMRWWSATFGTTETALRGFSALCGVLMVLVVYLLARRMLSPNLALLASALLAVSPFHIAYSQVVGYGMLLPLMSATQALLTQLLLDRPGSALRWLAWCVGALALLAASAWGLIVLVALGVVCAVKFRYSRLHLVALAIAFFAIAVAFALLVRVTGNTHLAALQQHAPSVSIGLFITMLVALGAWYGDAAPSALVAIPVLILLGLGIRLLTRTRRNMEFGILLAWLLSIPLTLFLRSFFVSSDDLALLLVPLPAYAILAAAGIAFIARKLRQRIRLARSLRKRPALRRALLWTAANVTVLIMAAVLLTTDVLLDVHVSAQRQSEPWRAVAAAVVQGQQKGDVILLLNTDASTRSAFDYYYLGAGEAPPPLVLDRVYLPSAAVKLLADDQTDALADGRLILMLNQLYSGYSHVWIVARMTSDVAWAAKLPSLMPHRFSLASQQRYDGAQVLVTLSLWANATVVPNSANGANGKQSNRESAA